MKKKANDSLPPDEEAALFERFAASAEPLAERHKTRAKNLRNAYSDRQSDSKEPPKFKKKKSVTNTASVPSQPISPRPVVVESTPVNPGLDKRQASRLRRGQMEISGRIDLHGDTQATAHRRLQNYLQAAYNRNARCILVITGKGGTTRNEPDTGQMRPVRTGVIRRMFPDWLAAPDLAPLVLSYSQAQPKDGGAGAFYVLLRRKRDT